MPGQLLLTEDLEEIGGFNILVYFPIKAEDWKITEPKILLLDVGDGPMSIDCKIKGLNVATTWTAGIWTISVHVINFPTEELQ